VSRRLMKRFAATEFKQKELMSKQTWRYVRDCIALALDMHGGEGGVGTTVGF
jgi:hypothetical protein